MFHHLLLALILEPEGQLVQKSKLTQREHQKKAIEKERALFVAFLEPVFPHELLVI
jgi:hypothetical protein